MIIRSGCHKTESKLTDEKEDSEVEAGPLPVVEKEGIGLVNPPEHLLQDSNHIFGLYEE